MRSSVFTCFAAATLVQAQIPTLLQLLQLQPDLSTLTSALLDRRALLFELGQLTNITVLAPTNAAFEKLLSTNTTESRALQAQDPEAISALLAYHVINGTYGSSSFSGVPKFVDSILDQSYSVSGDAASRVTVGQNVGLALNGGKATILSGDLKTSAVTEASLSDSLDGLNAQIGTSAISDALDTAALRDTLDRVPDLTVFIPNDRAFIAAASALQNASVETLRSVLQYHAITGSVVFSSDITNTTVPSAAGQNLTLSIVDGDVFVNQAKVIIANVLLSNGVAHVIDSVLNPNIAAVTSSARPRLTGAATSVMSGTVSSSRVVSEAQTTGSRTPTTMAATSSAIQTFTGMAGKESSVGFSEVLFGLLALLVI